MNRIALAVLIPWLAVGCVHSWPARADALDALQARVISVSKAASPSVVHIEAAIRSNKQGKLVTGSGFVTDASGIVVTNWHVVDRARRVSVVVPGRDGRYPAEVVGTDKQTDLAVLRIEPREGEEPFAAARLGDSDALIVGEWVVAIGNPYGLDGTVSLGIVSGKGRDLRMAGLLNDFIQTDAMIDHGSSGGPLFNLKGEVVGVNSRGQGRGIGFTIPINTAKRVVGDLLGDGRIARAYLGVSVQPLNRELAGFWGMPSVYGVVIAAVSPGSPADQAGLEVGDILSHVGNVEIRAEKNEDLGTFQRMIAEMSPGDAVALRVRRGVELVELTATLERQPKIVPDEEETDFGFTVQETTLGLYRQHRLRTRDGVLVSFVERGSEAAEAQMSSGDLIVAVNETPVATIEDFRQAMRTLVPGADFLLRAQRGDETRFLLIRPGEEDEPAEEIGDDAAAR